jgi:DNA (cytosine-5)-methyltransferase 1
MSNRKLKGLSFFSGAMGLDIGLEKSGVETLLACEIDKSCKLTISKNKPNLPLIGDVRDYSSKEIRKIAGLSPKEQIDVIFGGPPCQAFSSAGKRQGFEDERGNVFLTFVDHILNLKPKFVVLENVRGLLSSPLKHRPHNLRGEGFSPLTFDEQNGGALFYILGLLKSGGYGVSFNLYNSANFGSPQKRERVIIICSRDGTKLPFLQPTHSENGEFDLPKWVTVRQSFKKLNVKKHHFVTFPEKRIRYYKMLKSGQNWRNLPKELQEEALGASYYAGGGKTGFLRRLDWDKPSPTLVTHPAMPATDLAHPEENRPLSVEEYKCLQEFPENWDIEGNLISQYKQLGNAVPVSLGKAIGKLLSEHVNNKCVETYPNFTYSRYKNTNHIMWEKEFLNNNQHKDVQMKLGLG